MSSFFQSKGRSVAIGNTPGTKRDSDDRGVPVSPALESLTDEDLVEQLAAGKHDALTVLFERYRVVVFSIARRALGDDGEAEETLQQVFLDIYKAANQFDREKASFRTWLLQFAYHRSSNRRKHLVSRGFYTAAEIDEQLLPVQCYEGSSSTLHLASLEFGRLLDQLLATIQPRQKQTIEMTFIDGLTAEEIASRTGESAAVVRHNLYRGLKKLRQALLVHEQANKRTDTSTGTVEGVSFATRLL